MPADQLANRCSAESTARAAESRLPGQAGAVIRRTGASIRDGKPISQPPRCRSLKLKWAFGIPNVKIVRSQPANDRGRVFVGGNDGTLYSLDAATGCTFWATTASKPVRSGIAIGNPRLGRRRISFLRRRGRQRLRARFRHRQASLGRPRRRSSQRDDHRHAAFSPAVLYVPVSSGEEGARRRAEYECCTFRGSVVALDAATGQKIWQSYMATDPPARRQNQRRHNIFAPSGMAIWSAPTHRRCSRENFASTSAPATIIPIRRRKPATPSSRWISTPAKSSGRASSTRTTSTKSTAAIRRAKVARRQPIPNSISAPRRFSLSSVAANTISTQTRADPRPKKRPRLRRRSRRGRKASLARARRRRRPARWRAVGPGHRRHQCLRRRLRSRVPGPRDRSHQGRRHRPPIASATAAQIWKTPPPGCGDRRPCSPAQSQAVTAIPGAVFSGSLDGHLRAYATADGKIIWDFDTARDFDTVNNVAAHGGSLDVGGPIVAGGMMFVVSGYPGFGAMPGNVLLAFAAK